MLTFLSALPILALLFCLLVFKLPAGKSSAIALIITAVISFFTFKPGVFGFAVIMGKGFSLAIYVIFIIWGAMFLYNLVKETGALDVINNNIKIIVKDEFLQFLLLSWTFSAFLQGIAGFGVPVIVTTPILIAMGFNPILSASAVLLGHSWAISFGSMGSSISAIDMVTNVELGDILINMAFFGTIAMIVTGLSVCAIYKGLEGIRKGFVYIIITSIVMSITLFILARLQMTSVMGLISGLMGMITILIINKIKYPSKGSEFYKSNLNLFESFLPYILIVILSIFFFIINPSLKINLNFPGYVSETGINIVEELAYTKFNVLKYPFSIIIMASLISSIIYIKRKAIDLKKFTNIIDATVTKCTATTLTLVMLLIMAQLMMDAGMIHNLAMFLVYVTKGFYPFIAPFIGLLGAFVTGSNTNSNVLFGNLQETAALELGLSTAIICGVQSIGASIGGAIGPTTVALGATAAQMVGKESDIYKNTLLPILIGTTLLGIANLIIIYLF